MSHKDILTLNPSFETGDYLDENNFGDLIDSTNNMYFTPAGIPDGTFVVEGDIQYQFIDGVANITENGIFPGGDLFIPWKPFPCSIASYGFQQTFNPSKPAITSLNLPPSITKIGSGAFYWMVLDFPKLVIPDSVVEIEFQAFFDLGAGSTYTDCVIGDGCKDMGAYCFNSVISLTSIHFGNSLSSIGYSCFQSAGLRTVTIPESMKFIDWGVFNNCLSLGEVNCYVTKNIFEDNGNNTCLLGSGVSAIHVRSSDSTWTAGAGQTIAGKANIEVFKDL